MFLKRTRVRSGSRVYTYAQVVESYWDDGRPRHRVLFSLGRIDQLDPGMIARLAKSLAQLAPGVTIVDGAEDVHACSAKACGHTWALTALWEELGLARCLGELTQGRRIRFDLEAAVRAMVLARLSSPGSERKVLAWLDGVELPGSDGLRLQHLYRALDVMAREFPRVEAAYLGGLGRLVEVDASLCLLDTTSVSFEGEGPDGLAEYGYSRDKRPDLRQMVLGVMTSREGLPLGHVVLPGSTVDGNTLVEQVNVLREHVPLTRPVLVFDRGMVSERRLAELIAEGWKYIAAARLRTKRARAALAQSGRYKVVAENLQVKEVQVPGGLPGERLIVCYNPVEAERDRRERDGMVAKLREMAGSGQGVPKRLLRSVAARRFLTIRGGTVALDEARIEENARYDGKWVLRTNTVLPPHEVAQRYKGLWRIERAFRTLKSPLEIHPVYHWTQRRVRAHVGVCVLAYGILRLVERLVENAALGMSGEDALRTLERMTVDDTVVGGLGLRVRSDLTTDQQRIFDALHVSPPPRVEPLVANPSRDSA
jgi:hypothetical protein